MPIVRSFAVLALATLLAGCLGRPPSTADALPTIAATPTPPSAAVLETGTRVDIGGGRTLFIQCTAPVAGAPTVILEAGLAADHSAWAQVQPSLAEHARACGYDRAGLGQSGSASAPRDAAGAAADLRALLAAAGVPGPYILVGHSFGGLLVRRFATAAPDEVVGLVLVDAVHEDWWRRALAALPPEDPADSERLRTFRRFLSVEVADPTRNAEGFDIPVVAEQVRAIGPVGDLPVVVLVAGVADALAPGLPAPVEAELVRLLQRELPRELAALSSDSTLVVVPDSGHNIPAQRPDMVVLGVQAVLAAAGDR